VQALGFPTSRSGLVQVSMNLTDLDATPLHVAAARVRAEAERLGVEVAESELVGLVPEASALAAAAAFLGLSSLTRTRVLGSAYSDAARGAFTRSESPRV
jgi:glutamate formiminotransferase